MFNKVTLIIEASVLHMPHDSTGDICNSGLRYTINGPIFDT